MAKHDSFSIDKNGNLELLDDLEHFQQRLYAALGIPKEMLEPVLYESSLGMTTGMCAPHAAKIRREIGSSLSAKILGQKAMEDKMEDVKQEFVPFDDSELAMAVLQARDKFKGMPSHMVVSKRQYDEVASMSLNGVGVFIDSYGGLADDQIKLYQSTTSGMVHLWSRDSHTSEPRRVKSFTQNDFVNALEMAGIDPENIKDIFISRYQWSQRRSNSIKAWCGRLNKCDPNIGVFALKDGKEIVIDDNTIRFETKNGNVVTCVRLNDVNGWELVCVNRKNYKGKLGYGPFIETDFLDVCAVAQIEPKEIKTFFISEEQWFTRTRSHIDQWSPILCRYNSKIKVCKGICTPWTVLSNDAMKIETTTGAVMCCRGGDGKWLVDYDERKVANAWKITGWTSIGSLEDSAGRDEVPPVDESEDSESVEVPVGSGGYQYTHSAKFVFPEGTMFTDGCFGPSFEIPEPDPNDGWEKESEIKLWPMYPVVSCDEDVYRIASYGVDRRLTFEHDTGKSTAREYQRVAIAADACCVEYTVWRRSITKANTIPVACDEKESVEYKGQWPKRRPEECNSGLNEMMRHYLGPTVNEKD